MIRITRLALRAAMMLSLAGTATLTAPRVAAGQAQAQTTNQKVTFENVPVTVPGTGTFQVSGGLHLLFHTTRDAAGGFHVKLHANPQGVSATSTSGGSDYRVNGAANAQANIGATKGAASEGSIVVNLGLIGQGQAPNLRLHVNLHLTVNANGDVTATVANVRITQQG